MQKRKFKGNFERWNQRVSQFWTLFSSKHLKLKLNKNWLNRKLYNYNKKLLKHCRIIIIYDIDSNDTILYLYWYFFNSYEYLFIIIFFF